MGTEKVILKRLLRHGFFPRELPPVFRTKKYCDAISRNLNVLKSQVEFRSHAARFDGITYQGKHRMFGVVHPINYAMLASHLEENWGEIDKHLQSSKRSAFTISFPDKVDVGGRAFKSAKFSNKEKMGDEIASSFPMYLDLDINRFYGSIYTHSLPWAILGKEEAQKRHGNQTLDGHWSSDLDRLLRACNNNQTIGVPIGPDTSRIVSEIILTRIDIELDVHLSEFCGEGYFHNIDDYRFGSMSLQSCDVIAAIFEREIRKFELRTRDDKKKISDSLTNENHIWIKELNLIRSLQGVEFLDALFAIIASRRVENPNANILGFCLSRYSKRIANFSTRVHALSHLQRLLFSVPWAVNWVAPLFIGLKRGEALSEAQVRLAGFGVEESHRKHDIVSLLWYLYIFLNFNQNLSQPLSEKCLELDSPFIDIMLAHMAEKNLLEDRGVGNHLSERYAGRSLSSSSWIYIYETERRAWQSASRVSHIKKSNGKGGKKADAGAFFVFAEKAGVEFYDPSAFDLDSFSWRLTAKDFDPSDDQRVRTALGLDENDADSERKLPSVTRKPLVDERKNASAKRTVTVPAPKRRKADGTVSKMKSSKKNFNPFSRFSQGGGAYQEWEDLDESEMELDRPDPYDDEFFSY